MQDIIDVLKALGDENRMRIMLALRDGELCVCQLIDLLGLAPSTVSKHLSILRSARLVESRKEGRWMYYQISRNARFPTQAKISRLVAESVSDSPQVTADKRALKRIRNGNLEELCRKIMCRE